MAYESTSNKQLMARPAVNVSADRQENRKEAPSRNNNLEKTVHDFRSSLNIIIGYSELMLDGVMGTMNEEQRESINDILRNGQNLLNLVNDISVWRNAGPDSRK